MAKTLLLADGSVTIQRVIELTFAHEDIRVVSMADGRRAMQWLKSERPDIVLADVDLPETDGYAIAAHIRKTARLQKVPVLLLAGAFEPVDHDRARKIGCDGVIVKPFEPQQVVTRVRELLGEPEPVGVGSRESGAKASQSAPAPASVSPIRAVASHSDTPSLSPAGPVSSASAATPNAPPLKLDPLPLAPERLEIPSEPLWQSGPSFHQTPASRQESLPPSPPPKVSLVNAFSALLAAEQSTLPAPPAHAPAPPPAAPPVVSVSVSDASVEQAVRKVLVKMTDDLVRRIVVETAERLIREEIEKIKSNPE